MKYILLLGILIIHSGTNLIAQSASDNLKPKMKKVKEILYIAKNGELKSRENIFNSNIFSYVIMAFDKNEKEIENGRYEKDGSLFEKTIYLRNEKGNIIKAMKKNSLNEIKNYSTYEYDSDNNMIEVKTYDSQNNLTNIESNKYDSNGNNIETLLKSTENGKGWKYVDKYNLENKKIEEFTYRPDGSLSERRTYSYDKDGNENIQFMFKPNGSYKKFVSEYDKMNNLILQNWYNEKDEQTHQTSFEYVYDKNGNWITKKRSSNGVLNMVLERQIEYYK
ncbi:RHS repeat domain-containing protein [Tenacibaculum sp.]|uniref:RHS repeat domain-containing protein n=1 Tax=Tenacibaculum sp. TaxID=1906242 RepID=UPI003D0B7028